MYVLQVDVFAYGMVLYELLSQRSPFDDVHPVVKRNHEVRDGHRPALQAKETRTLIRLQELMELCWDKDAEARPKMSQAVEWVRAPEFERLRAEIALTEVKSVSCACVCRILPEHEPDFATLPVPPPDGGMRCETDGDGNEDFDSKLGGIGDLNSLVERFSGPASIDLIVPNLLPSISMESICIKNLDGKKISNDGEDVYQFLPSKNKKSFRKERGRTVRLADERRGGSVERVGVSGGRVEADTGELTRSTGDGRGDRIKGDGGRDSDGRRRDTGDSGEPRSVRSDTVGRGGKFDPYTQIWMCGRDQRKGMLQIFTYNDGHSGSYVSHNYV